MVAVETGYAVIFIVLTNILILALTDVCCKFSYLLLKIKHSSRPQVVNFKYSCLRNPLMFLPKLFQILLATIITV